MRTKTPEYLRLAKFFGKLFTINFALGLVTGIVQEFQFGMNWSDYSRFVGDIFMRRWRAGRCRLLPRVDLPRPVDLRLGPAAQTAARLTMVAVHVGTVLSAYFILAANSFMQTRSATSSTRLGPRRMTDFLAVLTNKVQLVTFPHVITSCYDRRRPMVMASRCG